MRKSHIKNNIELNEFDSLLRVAVEMSKYLYPYIREILQSRDNFDTNPVMWQNFKKRFLELINERFNINTMKVKRLLDSHSNDELIIKSLLTLALCNSDSGYQKLRNSLINF